MRIQALEKLLDLYECYFLLQSCRRLLGLPIPEILRGSEHLLTNAPQLRNYLRSAGPTGNDPKFHQKFMLDGRVHQQLVSAPFLHLPLSLYSWQHQSRHVYRLRSDLQGLLQISKLEHLKWDDIRFPFPAYGVELTQPLLLHTNAGNGSAQKEIRYPFVLIAQYASANLGLCCDIWAVPEINFHFPDQKRREQLLEWSAGGRAKLVVPILDQMLIAILSQPIMYCSVGVGGKTIGQILDIAPDQAQRQNLLWAIRSAVGIALWLEQRDVPPPHQVQDDTPPNQPRHNPPQSRKSGNGLGNAITDNAHIFECESTIPLTTEQRVLAGFDGTAEDRESLYELQCHWRGAHKRRRNGTGHIPDAPYVVRVKHYLVRPDRRPEGGLPLGAIQEL